MLYYLCSLNYKSGSLSHNNLTGLGANYDMIAHKFGHELSAKFDVEHGASLSVISNWI